MSFCENIKQIRKEKGISQEELADLLDVSRQAVSKWEQGVGYPEVDKLLLLSKKLNISLDSLMSVEIIKSHEPNAAHITGKITIVSPHEHIVATCYKVVSSGRFKGKEDSPKYALFAVSEQASPFWGQSNLFLGWYAKEEEIAREVAEIKNAIEAGTATYELQYTVKVERNRMKLKIVKD